MLVSEEQYIHMGGYNDDLVYGVGPEMLFYDSYSKTWFYSSALRVLNAEYHLNRNFVLGGAVALCEFYEFLGLNYLYEKYMNSDLIWDSSDGYYYIDFIHTKKQNANGHSYIEIKMIFDPMPCEYYQY